MAHVYPQASACLLLILFISESKADSAGTVSVSAYKEGDVILPCFNSTVFEPNSCYRVRLAKYEADASQKVIFTWPTQSRAATRAQWKQTSLYLTNITKADEGLYSCEVCVGWECMLVRNVSLKVKDCKASAPVKAVLSSPIQLNCSSESASGPRGPRRVQWAMLKGGNPVAVNFSSNRIKAIDASLVISAVDAGDSGWYRCQYMLEQTQHCSDVNLLVQAEKANTTAAPVVTATTQQAPTATVVSHSALTTVVACVLVGTVVLASLIGLFLCCARVSLRAMRQTQTHPPGAAQQWFNEYENVDLTEGSSDQQFNTLYALCEHGNTFQR